jgi:hypothetical protein
MPTENDDPFVGAAGALLRQIEQLAPMFTTPGEMRDLAEAFALVAGTGPIKPGGVHSG